MRATRLQFGKRLLAVAILAGLPAAAFWGSIPLAVQFHCGRARQFLQSRDNQQCVQHLRTALRLSPDRAEVFFLLARTHRRLGDVERVEPFLRQAQKLGGDPQRAQRETWLAWATSGRLRNAQPHLSELLMDMRDDGPEICAAYVQGYFTNLQPREAVQLLDAWQRDYPDDPQCYFMRGYLQQALAAWDEAAEAYRRGLALAPGETLMRARLAEVLGEMNENDEAGRQFRRCAEEAPANATILAAWAKCLTRQGDAGQARLVLQRALDKAPANFETLRQLGELELSQGNFQQALAPLQMATSQRPYDTTTRNALGKTLQALGARKRRDRICSTWRRPRSRWAAWNANSGRLSIAPRILNCGTTSGSRYSNTARLRTASNGCSPSCNCNPTIPRHTKRWARTTQRIGDRQAAARHRAQGNESKSPKSEKVEK